MGSDGGFYHRGSPCPVCGKGKAYRGNSDWHPFEGMVCSERCGLAAKQAVEAVQQTPKYRRCLKRVSDTRFAIAEMEFEAVRTALNEEANDG